MLMEAQESHNEEAIVKFHKHINDKVMRTHFIPKQETFNQDSFRPFFRKNLDIGFNPEDDEFLQTELTFKELFDFREKYSESIDMYPECFIDAKVLYQFARRKPNTVEELVQILHEYGISSEEAFLKQSLPHIAQIVQKSSQDYSKEKDKLQDHYK
jgi:hypothetical protein